MNPDDAIGEAGAATARFERDLETLLLGAFADGAAVEGAWEFELPVAAAPNWAVEIRKTYADAADETPESVGDRRSSKN